MEISELNPSPAQPFSCATSIEENFETFWKEKDQELALNRTWRLGLTNIVEHPRARPLKEFLWPRGPFRTEKRLLEVLNEFGCPCAAAGLLTPAMFRHLKYMLQIKTREAAKLRKQRSRIKQQPSTILTVEKS
jgi:hypothetical protein